MTTAPFENDRTTVEIQTISIWHGNLSNIPTGWALCDGNNGTPDLTDKFLSAPSDYASGSGTNIGTSTNTLSESQLASHDHPGGTGGGGNHSHGMHGYSGDGDETDPAFVDGTSGSRGSVESESAGSHSHSSEITNSVGSSNSIDNTPHHYEAALIYKL